MEFSEAMDYAIEKGKTFIREFVKFADDKTVDPLAKNKALDTMQTIWREMVGLEIVDRDGLVGIITNVQLVEWFFAAGTNPRDFMDMPEDGIAYEYDRFIVNLLWDRVQGHYPSVENAVKFMNERRERQLNGVTY